MREAVLGESGSGRRTDRDESAVLRRAESDHRLGGRGAGHDDRIAVFDRPLEADDGLDAIDRERAHHKAEFGGARLEFRMPIRCAGEAEGGARRQALRGDEVGQRIPTAGVGLRCQDVESVGARGCGRRRPAGKSRAPPQVDSRVGRFLDEAVDGACGRERERRVVAERGTELGLRHLDGQRFRDGDRLDGRAGDRERRCQPTVASGRADDEHGAAAERFGDERLERGDRVDDQRVEIVTEPVVEHAERWASAPSVQRGAEREPAVVLALDADAERHRAAAPEPEEHRSLGVGAAGGDRIMDRSEQAEDPRVVAAALDAQRSLSRRLHEAVSGQRDPPQPAEVQREPVEARRSEHDARIFAATHLVDAGRDVAAQVPDLQIGAERAYCGRATWRRGADGDSVAQRDAAALRVFVRGVVDEHVTGVRPNRHSSDRQTLGVLDRQILQRVDRDVDASLAQRVLQFCGEQALAADLRQRLVEDRIAPRPDDLDPEVLAGPRADQLGRGRGLGEGEIAAAGSDDEHGWRRLVALVPMRSQVRAS